MSDVNLTYASGQPFTIATTYSTGNPGWTSQTSSGGTLTSRHVCGNTMVLAGYTANQKRAVFTHEIGHALGLAHVGSASAIMYEYVTSLFTPQSDDIAGVNNLY